MAARRKRQKNSKAASRARQKASSPSARLAEAEKKFQQADYESAAALAANLLKRKDVNPLQTKARTIMVESCFRRAASAATMQQRLDLLNQALKEAPDDARLHYHRGVTLWHLGEVDAAQEALDTLSRQDSSRQDVNALRQLALAARAQATTDAELSAPEANLLHVAQQFTSDASAAEITPLLNDALPPQSNAELWAALLKMRDSAKAAPTEALSNASQESVSPVSPVVRYYRGVAALREKAYDSALDAWQGLAATGFNPPWVQDNRANLLRERAVDLADAGKWEEIVNLSSGQVDAADDRILNETVSAAQFHLGYAAAQQGDWSLALGHWSIANELNSNRYLAQNIALAQEALEEWQDAALAWREMVRRRPRKKNHPDYLTDTQVATIWAHAADCYAKAEAEDRYDYDSLYEEKITCLKNAVKYAPDDLPLRMRLVDAYLEEDRMDASANELDRVLEINEEYVPALVRLGVVRDSQWGGNPIPLWERALDLEPGNAEAREALADAVIAQVNGERPFFGPGGFRSLSPAASIKLLEKTAERVPNHPRLLAELGLYYNATNKTKKSLDAFRQSWEAAPTNPQIVGYVMHELLHVKGGDKIVTEKLPSVRQITVLRPQFWIAQASSVLNCELDEQWAINFWDEAVALSEAKKSPDTPIYVMISIIESATVEEVEHLTDKYEKRLRAEAANSGAIEFLDAFEAYGERQDTGKATRLLRTAKHKAEKAGETQLAAKAEQVSDLINGRINPLMNLFGGMGGGFGGGFGGGPQGGPGGMLDGLEDLFGEMDIDPEEFMDDFFKNL